jgi:hypothetical protein
MTGKPEMTARNFRIADSPGITEYLNRNEGPPIYLRKILDQNDSWKVQRFMTADREPRSPSDAECEGW